jgi:hypothetical protein
MLIDLLMVSCLEQLTDAMVEQFSGRFNGIVSLVFLSRVVRSLFEFFHFFQWPECIP